MLVVTFPAMAWVYLVIAGIFEVAWAIAMKHSEGFSRIIPSLWTVGLMIVSFVLLSQAVKTLPIGTGYAIWTGIGPLGLSLPEFFSFKSPVIPFDSSLSL